MLTSEEKQNIVKEYEIHEGDTGSPEVQIALLTERINNLSEHFKRFPKDNNSKRGFFVMIGRRKKLLSYLRREDFGTYKDLIAELGIRAKK